MSESLIAAALQAIGAGMVEVTTDAKKATHVLDPMALHASAFCGGPTPRMGGAACDEGDDDSDDDRMQVFVKSLTGRVMSFHVDHHTSIEDLKGLVYEAERIPPDQQRFVFAGKHLEEGGTLHDYGIQRNSTIHLVLRLRGGGVPVFYLAPKVLDSRFDYDFTNVNDRAAGRTFKRGGMAYERPCGWMRIALKVSKKYDGGSDDWLESDGRDGEWVVSYHGTSKTNARGIAKQGYDLTKGKRFQYGHGIYSTPEVDVAERYASTFTENDGSVYAVLLQNRVDPKRLTSKSGSETGAGTYFVSPQDAIRPYGLLIKKIAG